MLDLLQQHAYSFRQQRVGNGGLAFCIWKYGKTIIREAEFYGEILNGLCMEVKNVTITEKRRPLAAFNASFARFNPFSQTQLCILFPQPELRLYLANSTADTPYRVVLLRLACIKALIEIY